MIATIQSDLRLLSKKESGDIGTQISRKIEKAYKQEPNDGGYVFVTPYNQTTSLLLEKHGGKSFDETRTIFMIVVDAISALFEYSDTTELAQMQMSVYTTHEREKPIISWNKQ